MQQISLKVQKKDEGWYFKIKIFVFGKKILPLYCHQINYKVGHRSYILQVLFLLTFCFLNQTFVGQDKNSFGLCKETNLHSLDNLMETSDSLDHENQNLNFLNTVATIVRVQSESSVTRPTQRILYIKKNFKYTYLNNAPSSRSVPVDLFTCIVPFCNEKFNILLRVLII